MVSCCGRERSVVDENCKRVVRRSIDTFETEVEANESMSDCMNEGLATKEIFPARPFTPPFAQFHSPEEPKHKAVQVLLASKEAEVKGTVEVVYDSVLKCYYEPKSQKYYQLFE